MNSVSQRWVPSGLDGDPQRFSAAGTTLVNLFEQAVAAHPDSSAAKFDIESLTCAELDRRANVLARRLIAGGVVRNHQSR
ncbi:hypothetical protein ACIHAX_35785 [Nocardia sp. NPDC051929]